MADPEYSRFLARLREYERIEPFPSQRRPDKLAGIRGLLDGVGHPELSPRIVHVAGTNGKGMTSAMIARGIGRRGHSWGLYTSPHVMDIRERIVINGRWIAEAEFARAGHAVLDRADALRSAIHLSYFDLLTAIGLLAFQQAGVAWAVLETGLGGTADATNVTPKALAVLTRIGLDHMYVLGNTLREIAGEKLGIVRAGVPTVVAEQEPDLASWLPEQVQVRGSTPLASTLIRLSADPGRDRTQVRWSDGAALEIEFPAADFTDVRRQCATTALVALEAALGPLPPADRAALVSHVLSTRLPGRMERRERQRVVGMPMARLDHVVLDGGHNGPALAALNAQLERWGIKDYTLILGMQADKLVPAVLEPLRALLAHASRVITLAPQTARAPTREALDAFIDQALGNLRPARETCADAAAALAAAAREPAQPLVVTGSFWMLGDVMRLLEDAPPQS
jgi:dihydrofolate synthase/folylpolyglutamate synthase